MHRNIFSSQNAQKYIKKDSKFCQRIKYSDLSDIRKRFYLFTSFNEWYLITFIYKESFVFF